MVLHHVAERARLLVVARARADAFLLGHRDLHVIDVFRELNSGSKKLLANRSTRMFWTVSLPR